MYSFDNEYNVFISDNISEIGNFLQINFKNAPDSGWKIHISCIENNYNEILDIVSEYCVRKKITFKVVKNIDLYFKNGLKNGNRTSYGKFITVYPRDDKEFIKDIEDLYMLLKNYDGPYILTDKRYKDSKCLYYRYGSNKLQNIYDSKGNALRIIKQNNIEYKDELVGYYRKPDFVDDPFEFLNFEDESSRLMVKYNVEEGISFSPIGGIYKAQSQSNSQRHYIVKEFYPHTSIINSSIDSFTLFENEVSNLKKLQRFPFIPRYIESFKDWDNYYIIEEFIEGDTLEEYVATNNKIVLGDSMSSAKDYVLKILNIFLDIIDNAFTLYKHDYVLTDLSPDNILINDSGVYFVDLESVRNTKGSNQVINYTLNFYDINYSSEQNFKLSISSLLLYCFNKKSSLFSVFSPEQILEPITRRYPVVSEILKVITLINDSDTSINDIKAIFMESLKRVEKNNEIYKFEVESNSLTKIGDYKISSDMIKCKGFISDSLKNMNSLSYGTLGQFLACNYIFGKKYSRDTFEKYISDYRTTSYFWGHSGLLYILDLNNIKSEDVLMRVIENISYEDISLETGISGIGISLLHHYFLTQDERIIDIIKNIRKKLSRTDINSLDNSLKNGKLGIALFHIYDYYIFREKSSLNNSIEILENIISDLVSNNYQKSLRKDSNFDFYEYYIANGICGLVMVLIEFTSKTKKDIFLDNIVYFLKLCYGIYSVSPSYFTGNAGFLYTFFKAYKNIKLCSEMEQQILSQIECFYLDIMNTISDGSIYDANLENQKRYFLGGKEGILTIIDMVNNDTDGGKIFPFIL